MIPTLTWRLAPLAVAALERGACAVSVAPFPLDCGSVARSVSLVLRYKGGTDASPTGRAEAELVDELTGLAASSATRDVASAWPQCRVLASLGVSPSDEASRDSGNVQDDQAEFVLSDQFADVEWLGRRGSFHFMDTASWRLVDQGELWEEKRHALSVLFPPRSRWDGLLEALHAEVTALGVPALEDDDLEATHEAVFRDAVFTWILDARNSSVHPAFVRALSQDTIPIYSGWVLFTNMFHNAVLRVPVKRGGAADLLWQIRLMLSHQEDTTMRNYHHMIKDILLYRYRVPLADRLRAAACTLCKLPQPVRLAVVGVYSAATNWAKRAAIRATWGKFLQQRGVPVVFFLGSSASSGAADGESEDHAAEEARRFGDVVRLQVDEGYELNARKGLAFLQYVAKHLSDATFCIKVDDDVYWRPDGLLRMLEHRTPFRYVWGFLDLNSPVPREESDPFYLTKEEWHDEIFPPYPRGALRAMSMDVVHLLAAAATRRSYVIRGDDPSLGVHLRQLIMQDGEFLQLDDRGAMSRFAMEPTCITEGTYCPLKPTTWLVHHVSASTTRCMFQADMRAGYYRGSEGIPSVTAEPGAETFPNLCSCVDRNRWRWLLARGPRRPRPGRCPRRPKGGRRA